MEATKVSEIAVPVDRGPLAVPLVNLRRKDGGPVVVMVDGPRDTVEQAFLAKLDVLRTVGALPGARPSDASEDVPDADAIGLALKMAPALIESATYLQGEGGEEIRPAFWFSEERPGSLPGTVLTIVDRTALVNGVLERFGYVGGAVEDARFPDSERAGMGGGAGAVDAGEGNGADARGSAG